MGFTQETPKREIANTVINLLIGAKSLNDISVLLIENKNNKTNAVGSDNIALRYTSFHEKQRG